MVYGRALACPLALSFSVKQPGGLGYKLHSKCSKILQGRAASLAATTPIPLPCASLSFLVKQPPGRVTRHVGSYSLHSPSQPVLQVLQVLAAPHAFKTACKTG